MEAKQMGSNISQNVVQFINSRMFDVNNLNGLIRPSRRELYPPEAVWYYPVSTGPLITHFAGHRDIGEKLYGAIAKEFDLPSGSDLKSSQYAGLCKQWGKQESRACIP